MIQKFAKNGLLVLIFGYLIIYPLYSALVFATVGEHYGRHLDQLAGHVYFFNPWQYRALSLYLVEGWYQLLKASFLTQVPEEQAYYTAFKYFRALQHLLIFGSLWFYYHLFTRSRLLIILLFGFIALAMAEGAWLGDFTFNTYFDVLFYVWAAYLIFSGGDLNWFIPLTLAAGLNRETSIFIPFFLLLNYRSFLQPQTRVRAWRLFGICCTIYCLTFVGLRLYYGYQPPTPINIEPGPEAFAFNLTDPVTRQQLFNTLSILPLVALFWLRKVEIRLQLLFIAVVPIWFFAHFWLVWARETRLFLVPLIVIIIPVILQLIQRSFEKQQSSKI